MLFWNTTRDMIRSSAWKNITQETQINTWKVTPFCFIPERTSVPDLDEIQDCKGILKYHHESSVVCLGFRQSFLQVFSQPGSHLV